MFEAVISFLGLASAALYVGFLAYKIGSVPLWVIICGTFVLAIREFVADMREDSKRGNASGRSG
ncbi:MAG TPA: hypothetical protein VFX09_00660 [Burkholderiales bacterium]|nr:hypothetical protein [Burkholderiales bacterium]